jgi:hypothetical protein
LLASTEASVRRMVDSHGKRTSVGGSTASSSWRCSLIQRAMAAGVWQALAIAALIKPHNNGHG